MCVAKLIFFANIPIECFTFAKKKIMFRKFLSYFLPITKKIKSEYSGDLELTLYMGNLVLDTKNANYSYGSMKRILGFALQQIRLKDVKNMLLLGFGAGSVVQTLRKDLNFQQKITAIDIDPVIIEIAAQEFGIKADENTAVICADAYDFVKNETEKFDLVIVDLFIDVEIPQKFIALEFWQMLKKNINTKGFLIFNTLEKSAVELQQIERYLLSEGFSVQIFRQIERTNNLLVAQLLT